MRVSILLFNCGFSFPHLRPLSVSDLKQLFLRLVSFTTSTFLILITCYYSMVGHLRLTTFAVLSIAIVSFRLVYNRCCVCSIYVA